MNKFARVVIHYSPLKKKLKNLFEMPFIFIAGESSHSNDSFDGKIKISKYCW